jgi:hypothetical protein
VAVAQMSRDARATTYAARNRASTRHGEGRFNSSTSEAVAWTRTERMFTGPKVT